ncbi:MAG: uroporphyrinogen-III synthase [Chitinophagaceae bacterium]
MGNDMPYILCTRPVTEAQQQKAAGAGVVLNGISFIETVERKEEALLKKVQKLAGKELHVVFTSMNAVEAVARMIAADGAMKKQLPRWNIYSIGGRTAQLAREYFPSSIIRSEAPYGGMLAKKIILENPRNGIVFFCGNIRRNELPDQLLKHGFSLEEITVYDTISTPQQLERKYNGILFFSPSAVESYFSLNPPQPDQYFFAIGQTTADVIRSFSKENVLFSPTTDKEALIDTAIDFFKQQKTTKHIS